MNKVLKFAIDKHKNRFRADKTTPYIEHIYEVVEQLNKWGIKDNVILTTAYLHDIIEKTDSTISELNQFGDEVKKNVIQLTFDENKMSEDEYFKINKNNVVKLADHLTNTKFFIKNKIRNPYEYYKKGKVLVENFSNKLPFSKTINEIEKMLK